MKVSYLPPPLIHLISRPTLSLSFTSLAVEISHGQFDECFYVTVPSSSVCVYVCMCVWWFEVKLKGDPTITP